MAAYDSIDSEAVYLYSNMGGCTVKWVACK